MFPYIEVKGSHRQIGQAIGESLRKEIKKSLALHFSRFKFSKKDEANLRKLTITAQRKFPDFYDELVGISEGSQSDLKPLLIFSFEEELAPGEHCTSFAVHSQKNIYFAHNEDWDLKLPLYVIKAKPTGKPKFLAVSNAGHFPGTVAGFNDRGLVYSGNSIDTKINFKGMPKTYCLRKFLELGKISEAVKFINSDIRAVGNNSLLVSAREKKIAFLEWSPSDLMLEEDDRGLCHANHFLTKKMKDHQSTPTTESSINRLMFTEKKILEMKNPKLPSIQKILKTHFSRGQGICRHAEWKTLTSIIVDSSGGTMLVSDGNPCLKGYQKFSLS